MKKYYKTKANSPKLTTLGFTIVELITSFTLATVVMLILFNVIIIMKDKLSETNIKTKILVEKDNLSYNINKRLKEKELSSITLC